MTSAAPTPPATFDFRLLDFPTFRPKHRSRLPNSSALPLAVVCRVFGYFLRGIGGFRRSAGNKAFAMAILAAPVVFHQPVRVVPDRRGDLVPSSSHRGNHRVIFHRSEGAGSLGNACPTIRESNHDGQPSRDRGEPHGRNLESWFLCKRQVSIGDRGPWIADCGS